MKHLKLSFIYAYPLDRGRRNLFLEKGLDYPSMENVQSTIDHWKQIWMEVEEKVISHIAHLTERNPDRNLECFVFGAGLQAMSTPFLLPTWNKKGEHWTDEKFIEIVIHELLHIFLGTNNNRYWKHVREKFKAEEILCQNHILLYAMLYDVYQKVFGTEPGDFKRDNLPQGYARAVEIVKEIGSEELIADYKSHL